MTRRESVNLVTPDPFLLGRRVAFFDLLGGDFLAVLNITTGLMGGSTSVLATGLKFFRDVLVSSMELFGIVRSSSSRHRPPVWAWSYRKWVLWGAGPTVLLSRRHGQAV